MQLIMKLLAGSAGPYVAGAVAALLSILFAAGAIQTARLHHAKADLSAAHAAQIDPATKRTWQSEALAATADLATCRSGKASLQAALDRQNAAVADLAASSAKRAAMLTDALASARTEIRAADVRASALLSKPPTGADVCSRLLDVDRQVLETAK